MLNHIIYDQSLKSLFETYSDFSFYDERNLQILELKDGKIPEEKDNSLTHIYIYNDLKSIKKNILPQELSHSNKVLSKYNLKKSGWYNIPYFSFCPLVDTQIYKINNPDAAPEFIFCDKDDELSSLTLCIQTFLCGNQPVLLKFLENFEIDNIIIIKDKSELEGKTPIKLTNNFRGCLAEKFGFMENFITLEHNIKKTLP